MVPLDTLSSAIDKDSITPGLLRDSEEDIQNLCQSLPPISGNIKVSLPIKTSTSGDELKRLVDYFLIILFKTLHHLFFINYILKKDVLKRRK